MATMNLLDRVSPPYAPSRIRWATVRIVAESAVYEGRLHVPETQKRLSEVLSDERPFVSLTEVSINGSAIVEPFVAVSKRCIRTIHVLDEGTLEGTAYQGSTAIAPSR